MAVFKVAFINELEKLYKKKKAVAAVILSFLVIILGQLLILGVRSGFGIRGAGGGDFPLLVLSVVIYSLLPLFVALVTIDSFSGEFANQIIRITLTRPVSRFKIFAAKVCAIAVFILFTLLIVFVFSTIIGVLFNGNGMDWSGLGRSLLAYLASLLPLLILTLGIILLTHIMKSGISVFFMVILLFGASQVLALVFPQYSSIFITTHLGWYKIWLAQPFPVSVILRDLFLMTGFGMMLFVAGLYLFERKEF